MTAPSSASVRRKKPQQTGELAHYVGQRPAKPRFWLRFAYETLRRQEIVPLARTRLRGEPLHSIVGVSHLPTEAAFVLAVNHYSGRATLDATAAVITALADARPQVAPQTALVIGHRWPPAKSRLHAIMLGIARPIVSWIFARWEKHTLRIPLKNPVPSPAGLREWRARQQPVLVFPEGRARVKFGKIRAGAGRWLATLGMPVLPVGVWWEAEHGWSVQFGPPLRWADRDGLRDLQLGLAMAALLPEPLAQDWHADLTRWRNAHQDTETHD